MRILFENLLQYLKRMGVDVRSFRFEEHTMTADAAVRRLGVNREKIIRRILFVDDTGLPILGIVTGDRRVSVKKLAIACGARKVRRAGPDEVRSLPVMMLAPFRQLDINRRYEPSLMRKSWALIALLGAEGKSTRFSK